MKRKPSLWVLPKDDGFHSFIPIGRGRSRIKPIWVFADWALARRIVEALNRKQKP